MSHIAMQPKDIYTNVSPVDPPSEQPFQEDVLICRDRKSRRCNENWTALFTDGWALELIALLLGCALIAALFIVLNSYDGKAMPYLGTVLGTSVTLNTVVAVVGIAIQAFLLFPIVECLGQLKWQWMLREHKLQDMSTFDKASRGVLGSLAFIWKIHLRSIGTLGAILIALAIILNPFLQQMVSLDTIQVASMGAGSLASTPVVQAFMDTADTVGIGSPFADALASTSLSTTMKGAIESGLYAPKRQVQPLAPFCSTGNCTFPSHQSLAICSNVVDISTKLQYNDTGPDYAPVFYLPTGHYIEPGGDRGGSYVNVSTTRNGSLAYSSIDASVADTYILVAFGPRTGNISDLLGSSSIRAYEVNLEWCIQSYASSVVNGVATTNITSQFRNFTTTLDYNNETLLVNSINSDGNALHYQVEYENLRNLQAYFGAIFNGNIFYQGAYGVRAPGNEMQALFTSMTIDNTTLGYANYSMNFTGLSTVMSNIASSMTNAIRQGPSNNVTIQTHNSTIGQAWSDTTVVSIRWRWASGPLVFAFLTIMFVVIVILASHVGQAQQLGNWKTSSLAVLHALDPSLQQATGGITRLSHHDTQAKDVRVRLQRERDDLGPWRLVASQVDADSSVVHKA